MVDCLVCECCGKRRGRKVLARYRRNHKEPWDAWKVPRTLIICGFCKGKTRMTGYAEIGNIWIEEILPENKTSPQITPMCKCANVSNVHKVDKVDNVDNVPDELVQSLRLKFGGVISV